MGRSKVCAEVGGAAGEVTTDAAGTASIGAAARSPLAAAASSAARASCAGGSDPRSSWRPESNCSAKGVAATPGTELLAPLAKRPVTPMRTSARTRLLRLRARRTAPTPPDEASASFVRQEVVSSELSYAAESSIAVFLVFPDRDER
jgi:hypothetical protein